MNKNNCIVNSNNVVLSVDKDYIPSSLCSPVKVTFDNDELSKLESIGKSIAKCGTVELEYYDVRLGNFVFEPQFCNNRICDVDGCRKHRRHLYMVQHNHQIFLLHQSMKNPKGWVFTNGHYPVDELPRKYFQDELKRLYKLLKEYASSEFSVHMEVKMSVDHPGTAYFHFHVVMAGTHDLKGLRKEYGFQIFYEDAIHPQTLGYYVSKYASKTPRFPSNFHQDWYALCVYKLQMNKFSVSIPKRESRVFVVGKKRQFKRKYLPNRYLVSRLWSEMLNTDRFSGDCCGLYHHKFRVNSENNQKVDYNGVPGCVILYENKN